MAKKVLVSIPPQMIKEIDAVAKIEFRNRSDLIREALRRYADTFRQNYKRPMPDNRFKISTINGVYRK